MLRFHLPTVYLPTLRQFWNRPNAAGRVRRLLWWSGFAIGFSLLVIYHVTLVAVGQGATFGTRFGADVLAMATFSVLGYLIHQYLNPDEQNPLRMLWTPLLAAGLGMLCTTLFVAATGGPATVDPELGIPDGLRSVFQISGVATLEIAVAFLVLVSLQALVMFRRTSASSRNWYVMIGLMAGAAMLLAGRGPIEAEGTFIPHMIVLVLAMLFMVANAFRLAWIAYLPFRQKVQALGLVCALLVGLILLIGSRSGGGWIGSFFIGGGIADLDGGLAVAFSAPVNSFIELSLAFGILYGTTALLALLFHLPTARAMQQKTGEMEALQALARLSTDVFDRPRLLNTIAGAPVEAGVAEATWLALIEPERGSMKPHIVAAQGLTTLQIRSMADSEQLAEDAGRANGTLVLQQAPADHRVHARPGDGIGSLVVLPLRVHDRMLGTLFAARAIPHGFERDDVAALETFASQAALSISSARLVNERIEHERASRELSIARDVQRRLLPARLPSSDRMSCSALSLPAYEVAGDYYDVLSLVGGRTGLIVADVAGKGTSAAFHMAEMKGVFQSAGRLATGPAEFLVHANEALASSLERSAFITAIYAILDDATGTLIVARAGHCPAILATRDRGVRLLRPAGLGIGLDSGPLFKKSLEEETCYLKPGDTLFLYTDGLVEARNAGGEEFGYDRLVDSVARHRHRDPDGLRDAVVADVQRFAEASENGKSGIDDDLTLVVLKWSATPATADLLEEPDTTQTDLLPA